MSKQMRVGTAVLESHPDGFIIRIPPRGLFWGSMAPMFFLFALAWWGILALGRLDPLEVLGQGPEPNVGGCFAAIVLWLFGVPMLLIGIRDARKHAYLEVAWGRLLVCDSGILQATREEWPVGQIDDVYAVFNKENAPVTLDRDAYRSRTPSLQTALAQYPSLLGSLVIDAGDRTCVVLEGTRGAELITITLALREALGLAQPPA